jgi:DNA-binding Xre family transcriptional regulator
MSQTFLAYRAGISRSALNAIESGQNRDLRLATVIRIAEALEATPDQLLGYRPAA